MSNEEDAKKYRLIQAENLLREAGCVQLSDGTWRSPEDDLKRIQNTMKKERTAKLDLRSQTLTHQGKKYRYQVQGACDWASRVKAGDHLHVPVPKITWTTARGLSQFRGHWHQT